MCLQIEKVRIRKKSSNEGLVFGNISAYFDMQKSTNWRKASRKSVNPSQSNLFVSFSLTVPSMHAMKFPGVIRGSISTRSASHVTVSTMVRWTTCARLEVASAHVFPTSPDRTANNAPTASTTSPPVSVSNLERGRTFPNDSSLMVVL